MALTLTLAGTLAALTAASIRPLPSQLPPGGSVARARVLSRDGLPLSVSYENRWNLHDAAPLYEIPTLLRQAVVAAEDRRFLDHSGVDWRARTHALLQNLLAGRRVRGASTISEQVVRMLHPRRRTLWAKWVETWEARRLERRFSKGEILEFYLNQVPYARRRRGVVQAARDLFGRELDTLSEREMLALAVIIRAPSRLDPRRRPSETSASVSPPRELLDSAVDRLRRRLIERGDLDRSADRRIREADLELSSAPEFFEAPHFVRFVRRITSTDAGPEPSRSPADEGPERIVTTLDAGLQRKVERILSDEVARLASRGVHGGAALVVDHRRGEVLAWVMVGGSAERPEGSGVSAPTAGYAATGRTSQIDAVITPRQPGSTLKPLLYALALDDDLTAATLIDDSPYALPVGTGLHHFRNYSRHFYGPLRLRLALGNSLNVPAVRTVRAVGAERFLETLHRLGIRSLDRPASFYGEGLALGSGEITLYELVQAYAALARGGVYRPLRVLAAPVPGLSRASATTPALSVAEGGEAEESGTARRGAEDLRLRYGPGFAPRRIFSEEAATLIGNILSDPAARRLEFGGGGVLELPVQTAVKTGTSNDYRDAWTVGYGSRYVVGVWMGNLDRQAMLRVTGAAGPALAFRSIMAELRQRGSSRSLPLSRRLRRVRICGVTGLLAGPACPTIDEWFRSGHEPRQRCSEPHDDRRPASHRPAIAASRLPGPGPARSDLRSSPGGRIAATARGIPAPAPNGPRLLRPTPGLRLARDPRLPGRLQAYPFLLQAPRPPRRVEWRVDGRIAGRTQASTRLLWPLEKGTHRVFARVWFEGQSAPEETTVVEFQVR